MTLRILRVVCATSLFILTASVASAATMLNFSGTVIAGDNPNPDFNTSSGFTSYIGQNWILQTYIEEGLLDGSKGQSVDQFLQYRFTLDSILVTGSMGLLQASNGPIDFLDFQNGFNFDQVVLPSWATTSRPNIQLSVVDPSGSAVDDVSELGSLVNLDGFSFVAGDLFFGGGGEFNRMSLGIEQAEVNNVAPVPLPTSLASMALIIGSLGSLMLVRKKKTHTSRTGFAIG